MSHTTTARGTDGKSSSVSRFPPWPCPFGLQDSRRISEEKKISGQILHWKTPGGFLKKKKNFPDKLFPLQEYLQVCMCRKMLGNVTICSEQIDSYQRYSGLITVIRTEKRCYRYVSENVLCSHTEYTCLWLMIRNYVLLFRVLWSAYHHKNTIKIVSHHLSCMTRVVEFTRRPLENVWHISFRTHIQRSEPRLLRKDLVFLFIIKRNYERCQIDGHRTVFFFPTPEAVPNRLFTDKSGERRWSQALTVYSVYYNGESER